MTAAQKGAVVKRKFCGGPYVMEKAAQNREIVEKQPQISRFSV